MRLAAVPILLLFALNLQTGCTKPGLPDTARAKEAPASVSGKAGEGPVPEKDPEKEKKSESPPGEISPELGRNTPAGTAEPTSPGEGGAAHDGDDTDREKDAPVPVALDPVAPPTGETGAAPRRDAASESPAAFVYDGGLLTEDVAWSGRVVVDGALTIAPQATVTLMPGTRVEFRVSSIGEGSSALIVQGRIDARGTPGQPVVFAAAADGAPSRAWQGIVLLASEKKNVLEHCRIEGAETGVDALYSVVTVKNSVFSGCRNALRAQDSLVFVSGYTASNCDLGLGLYDSEAELHGVKLFTNRMGIFAKRSSLYLSAASVSGNDLEAFSAEECKVKIVKNTFERNGSGLALSSCEGLVSGNRILKNLDFGISLAGSRVRVTANEITGNGGAGIRVGDGKGIAWGNGIFSNGRYDLYNAGPEDFRAIGNWWGDGRSPAAPGIVYDKSANPASGRVLYLPVLRSQPETAP